MCRPHSKFPSNCPDAHLHTGCQLRTPGLQQTFVIPDTAIPDTVLDDHEDDRLLHLIRPVRTVALTRASPDAAALSEISGEAGETPGSAELNLEDSTLYPLPALFLRQCLPESAWEPDNAAQSCRACSKRFSLFLRRHHCRRCGLLFCVSCSSKRALLASPETPSQPSYYVSQPPLTDDDNAPLAQLRQRMGQESAPAWVFRDHRVCDPCAQALDPLPVAHTGVAPLAPDALAMAASAAENAYGVFRELPLHPQGHQRSSSSDLRQRGIQRRSSTDSIRVCPVCDRSWASVWVTMRRMPGEGWQETQERHVRSCIEDTSAEMQGVSAQQQSAGARRSRSVQGRMPADRLPQEPPLASSQPPRRSTGFLGFFDRTLAASDDADDTADSALESSTATHSHSHNHREPGGGSKTARSPAGVRYVVYNLTGDTPLLGQECAICFEDFEPGQRVARLNCLCTYHVWCISEWLQRTPACPVHYE
ncbi:hypothetical protein GGI07_000901 [Coemansia sp. Benny D115]|nr:hypothetical protein GGI07_000901 [Coemansia sp. Benny D115]